MDKETIIRLTAGKNTNQDDLKELAFMYGITLNVVRGHVFQASGTSVHMLHFVWALGSKQIPFNLIK